MTDLDGAEAILGSSAEVQLSYVGNIGLSEVGNWPGLCIYGSVVQGYLPPIDS
jgi:hypothetical protein